MNDRKSISVEYQGGIFEFHLEPTIIEERQITNKMVELLGGWDNYSNFDATLKDIFRKHQELIIKKLGEEIKIKKEVELQKLQEEGKFDKYYFNLFQELNGNIYYRQFLSLIQEKSKVSDYAFMIIMCSKKPDDFIFERKPPEVLDGLLTEMIKKHGDFRSQKKKSENSQD